MRQTYKLAGYHNQEINKAISIAKTSGDRNTYEATLFLINSMDEAFSMEGPSLNEYYKLLSEFYDREHIDMWSLYAFEDSLFSTGNYFHDLIKTYDHNSITSDYILSRVDNALQMWQSPFSSNLNFQEFCNYLLPYRIGTEELEYWWEDYRLVFGHTLDSLSCRNDVTIFEFCKAINSLIPEPHRSYNNYPATKPSARPSSLVKILGGTCDDYVALTTYICRSYGIPVCTDFTPQWSNHSSGHSWCAIIQGDSTYHYMVGEPPFLAREKPFSYKPVKIYRKMQSVQKDALASQRGIDNIPTALCNPKLKDVTNYYMDVCDIHVNKLFRHNRSKLVYLSCFDDKSWVPVCGAKRFGHRASFKDVGYPAVFLPQYFKYGHFFPAQYPILIDSLGILRILKPDTTNVQTVKLKRKYMDRRAWQFVDSLRGGAFELSNSPDFSKRDRLVIPDTINYSYQSIPVNGRYRYLRYVPKQGGSGNIAEIEVYNEKRELIRGKVIGTYNAPDSFHPMENAFDSDVLTYVACNTNQEDAWIGLDLGHQEDIRTICYLPRSDDNFIRDGEVYELCYWDNGWIPLGKQIGSRISQELLYDNVPANALLLLHNYSKGKEERIFTYEHDNQIWW